MDDRVKGAVLLLCNGEHVDRLEEDSTEQKRKQEMTENRKIRIVMGFSNTVFLWESFVIICKCTLSKMAN